MSQRAEHRVSSPISQFRLAPESVDSVAERFCDEMIETLRLNVGEQRQRMNNEL